MFLYLVARVPLFRLQVSLLDSKAFLQYLITKVPVIGSLGFLFNNWKPEFSFQYPIAKASSQFLGAKTPYLTAGSQSFLDTLQRRGSF
jgi:hypothetical protein